MNRGRSSRILRRALVLFEQASNFKPTAEIVECSVWNASVTDKVTFTSSSASGGRIALSTSLYALVNSTN